MQNIKQKFIRLNRLFQKDPRFLFIKKIFENYPEAEMYLVGGMVRDIIVNRPSKDYDFVVRNVPLKKLKELLAKYGWVDLVGRVFGVLKFMPKEKGIEPIDIALPRTEHAFLTGGYKDFKVRFNPKLPLEKDLVRRDFTINALAWDIKNEKLIDHFDGLKDIKTKTIKAIGSPKERLKEDYSRIFRALRLSCQLNFKIKKGVWDVMVELMPKINDKKKGEFILPRETIGKEIIKTFAANPLMAFHLYDKTSTFKFLMPEILKMKKCPQPENFHSEGDVWQHTKLCLKNLDSKTFRNKYKEKSPSALLIFGLLFHDLGKPYTIQKLDRLRFNEHDNVGAKKAVEICHRLKLSSFERENKQLHVNPDHLGWLISKHMLAIHAKADEMKPTTIEKYFFNPNRPGDELLKLIYLDISATIPKKGKPDFSSLRKLEKRIAEIKKLSGKKKELPKSLLNGNEIMQYLKISSGPKIGELLEILRQAQLSGKIKTKKEGYEFLDGYLKKGSTGPDPSASSG